MYYMSKNSMIPFSQYFFHRCVIIKINISREESISLSMKDSSLISESTNFWNKKLPRSRLNSPAFPSKVPVNMFRNHRPVDDLRLYHSLLFIP